MSPGSHCLQLPSQAPSVLTGTDTSQTLDWTVLSRQNHWAAALSHWEGGNLEDPPLHPCSRARSTSKSPPQSSQLYSPPVPTEVLSLWAPVVSE